MMERRMGKAVLLGGFALSLLIIVGCQSPQRKSAEMRVFSAEGTSALPKRYGEGDEATSFEITARGLPPSNVVSESEKKFTAIEAAKYRAVARLVEELRGADVDLQTRVKDMVFAGQELNVKVKGHLRGVEVLESRYDKETGVAYVTVALIPGWDGGDIGNRIKAADSKAAKKIQAESAARLNALGNIMEQVGDVRIDRTRVVRDLMFESEEAWSCVQGILEGVSYSEPSWDGDKVSVNAVLKIPESALEPIEALVE